MKIKSFKLRLIAIYRIIRSRNFILIDGLDIYYNDDKKGRKSRLLRRTDFPGDEEDFLFMKQSIMSSFDVKNIENKL